MQEEEIELQFIDAITQLESVLSQQSALHASLQRGAQLLTRERTHGRRRLELDLVDATRLAPTRRLTWCADEQTFAIQPHLAEDPSGDDDDDGDDDDSKSTALVALGGAMPSQVLRDAQRAYDECLESVVRLANDRLRLAAAVARYSKLLSEKSRQR